MTYIRESDQLKIKSIIDKAKTDIEDITTAEVIVKWHLVDVPIIDRLELKNKIITAVCDSFRLSQSEFEEMNGKDVSIHARFVTYKILCGYYKISAKAVGRMFGYKHSTILNGVTKCDLWANTDKVFSKKYKKTLDKLKLR